MTTTVGKVQKVTKIEFIFEYIIEDFFSLYENDEKCFCSPTFLIDGEYWFLRIYPNGGGSSTKSVGYISIYLRRKSSGPSKHLTWTFSLKTVDDDKDCEGKFSYTFTKDDGYGSHEFLKRSELLKKIGILAPNGILTVICTIESCSKSTDDTGNALKARCSYCKEEFDDESISSHNEKCLDKCIKCPTCNDVVKLRKWFDHQCPVIRVEDKLVEDLASICGTQEYSDVTVKVKDEEFHLHKIILTARSPYFKSMLNAEMKEKTTGTISIKDCEPGIFRSFIHFVYTGKVGDLSVENVCELYILADKYQEDQLKEECVYFMKKEMCVETFCDFLVLALKYDEKELLNDATDIFCREVKEILPSVKWQSFIKEYPTQSNELTIKAFNYITDSKR